MDHIAALVLQSQDVRLQGKDDLDAYLVAYCPNTQKPEVFKQKVLPFGSVASVTAFLRISQAIWKLGTVLFGLMWSSYFDDFYSVEEVSLSRHTDMVISALFGILGWKLSSDKLILYGTVCKVLGVEFFLRMASEGLSFVCNTDERVSELCEHLDNIISSRQLRKSDGERLRGRLQFACGQLFGRFARNHIRILSNHIRANRNRVGDDTLPALECIRNQIMNNGRRKIVGSLSDHVYIYMDASFEDGKYSGLGGAVYDDVTLSKKDEKSLFLKQKL